jgi:hypothetical protein
MDIERVIKKIRNIKESVPTNSSGANGFTNAAGSGPRAGFDKRLFGVTNDLLSQDYQTPDESGLALYRFSNVYPVEKLSEKDVDDMVAASKEYDKLVDEQRFGRKDYMKEKLQRVIDTIRSLKEESNPRIPRKKGQPANSKKHSDLYTDENPKGTIHGLGFKNVATAKESVSKIRNSSRSHAHKIQAAVAMEQRAREMGKTSEAAVYRKFINSMKKKTKKMNEEMGAAGAVPTNNASSGNIAGLPPDSPPVKKKKRYIYSGRGSRRMWLDNMKNG